MTFDYNKTADTSLKLLTKFGRDVTHRAVTVGTYDPTTGSVTNTTADTTRKGAVVKFAKETERGNLIQANDKRLLLDAEGSLDMDDLMVIDSVSHTIVSFGIISPSGTVVLYDIHLRA